MSWLFSMGNNHIQENTEQHIFHQTYITKQSGIHQTSAVLSGKNVFPQKTYSPPKKIHSPPKKDKTDVFNPKDIYIQKNKEIFPKSYIPQKNDIKKLYSQ